MNCCGSCLVDQHLSLFHGLLLQFVLKLHFGPFLFDLYKRIHILSFHGHFCHHLLLLLLLQSPATSISASENEVLTSLQRLLSPILVLRILTGLDPYIGMLLLKAPIGIRPAESMFISSLGRLVDTWISLHQIRPGLWHQQSVFIDALL